MSIGEGTEPHLLALPRQPLAQLGSVIAKRQPVWEKPPSTARGMRAKNNQAILSRALEYCKRLQSAGVVQWQNGSFPSCIRGFDSLRPLQALRPIVRKGDAATSVNCEKPQRNPAMRTIAGASMIPIASPASFWTFAFRILPLPVSINSAPAHIRRVRRRPAADIHRPAGARALACAIGA
jgi:hypothetical protein